MSRLTGSDVKSMMEAYAAVYAPQELTEEQVWEEVETWVNSLLEEGYDLSEYTWEEMYESYIEEQGIKGVTIGPGGFNIKGKRLDNTPSPIFARPKPSAPAAAPVARPAAAAPVARPAAAPVARPSTRPSTRPAATSKPAAKPAGPAIGKLGSTTFERRTPTSTELKAAQAARASGASPEKALQAAKSAGGALSQATAAASKPAAFNPTSTSTPAAAPKPPTRQLSAADKRQGIKASYEYDAYDLVLEYLLAEGHADTVEEANYVMLEMDAEMVQDIVETCLDEAVKGAQRSIANRITGNDIRKVTRGDKSVYKKPKSNDDIENKVSGGSQLRKTSETENMNDRRDRERIEANKKSIKRLNAKPGEDSGDYDAGYYGDDDTSDGKRHYSLSRTNRDARRRRASGR